MIDVALALEYLHCGQLEPVVHCDEDMVAHVADFGIAKILAKNKTAVQTRTLGTIGYIAPEYGSEGRVTTNGDIYRYGVMLLEHSKERNPQMKCVCRDQFKAMGERITSQQNYGNSGWWFIEDAKWQ